MRLWLLAGLACLAWTSVSHAQNNLIRTTTVYPRYQGYGVSSSNYYNPPPPFLAGGPIYGYHWQPYYPMYSNWCSDCTPTYIPSPTAVVPVTPGVGGVPASLPRSR